MPPKKKDKPGRKGKVVEPKKKAGPTAPFADPETPPLPEDEVLNIVGALAGLARALPRALKPICAETGRARAAEKSARVLVDRIEGRFKQEQATNAELKKKHKEEMQVQAGKTVTLLAEIKKLKSELKAATKGLPKAAASKGVAATGFKSAIQKVNGTLADWAKNIRAAELEPEVKQYLLDTLKDIKLDIRELEYED